MSNISEFNAAACATTDREHGLQLGMLQALCEAAHGGHDAAGIAKLLEGLTHYSEAHFISEELVMRQKSYDDYEDHVDDHNHMLEALRDMAVDHASGNSGLLGGKAQEALRFISTHISTRDRRFADYLRTGG